MCVLHYVSFPWRAALGRFRATVGAATTATDDFPAHVVRDDEDEHIQFN